MLRFFAEGDLEAQIARKRRRDEPRKLPKVRKRALTLPLPELPSGLISIMRSTLTVKQETKDQSLSPLLVLPLEIRNLIYGHIYG